jgi:hypothetical protein
VIPVVVAKEKDIAMAMRGRSNTGYIKEHAARSQVSVLDIPKFERHVTPVRPKYFPPPPPPPPKASEQGSPESKDLPKSFAKLFNNDQHMDFLIAHRHSNMRILSFLSQMLYAVSREGLSSAGGHRCTTISLSMDSPSLAPSFMYSSVAIAL